MAASALLRLEVNRGGLVCGCNGALYRERNSKVATTPKLKVDDKDRVNNSCRIRTVKLNIVKLKASLN